MKRFNLFIVSVFAFCLILPSAAICAESGKKDPKKGYKIVLHIDNADDSVMFLGNYYAGKTYVVDTARRDKKNNYVFEHKDRLLMPGMYFFTNPAYEYVEFIIHNEEPYFTFETSRQNWTTNMRVKGSKENEYLFFFQRANRRIYYEIDSAQKAMGEGEAFTAFRNRKMIELDSIKEVIIGQHPDCMLSLMMNATREPAVPTEDENGQKLSNRERWEYYMDHYFDYMALDDDAIVRTPEMIFSQRITNYLDKNLKNASAEIICTYVDKLIERARPSKEVFKYLVHTIAEKYLQSNIMSYDAVYVHMVKKYIETGDCFWMSPTTVDENVRRANTWEKLLIGKPAPPLIMRDTKGEIQSLYSLDHKYTLLIFWSPTCGHCKVIIPELYKKYAQYRDQYDICAYAILSEPDDATRPKWYDFIQKNNLDWLNIDGGEANIDWHEVYDIETTPQIYLLDRDKVILAKKLNAESFEMVLKAIEGIE
ncbi:MAG: DUF5106 domain-containing protein [Bacteroidales bacterium]|nr:DUF5106 domain-containing protein [Bacteroidales bacterium]